MDTTSIVLVIYAIIITIIYYITRIASNKYYKDIKNLEEEQNKLLVEKADIISGNKECESILRDKIRKLEITVGSLDREKSYIAKLLLDFVENPIKYLKYDSNNPNSNKSIRLSYKNNTYKAFEMFSKEDITNKITLDLDISIQDLDISIQDLDISIQDSVGEVLRLLKEKQESK